MLMLIKCISMEQALSKACCFVIHHAAYAAATITSDIVFASKIMYCHGDTGADAPIGRRTDKMILLPNA